MKNNDSFLVASFQSEAFKEKLKLFPQIKVVALICDKMFFGLMEMSDEELKEFSQPQMLIESFAHLFFLFAYSFEATMTRYIQTPHLNEGQMDVYLDGFFEHLRIFVDEMLKKLALKEAEVYQLAKKS